MFIAAGCDTAVEPSTGSGDPAPGSGDQASQPDPKPAEPAPKKVVQTFSSPEEAIQVLCEQSDQPTLFAAYTWLGKQGPSAVPLIEQALASESTALQAKVFLFRSLATMGKPGQGVLIRESNNELSQLRISAIKELGKIEPSTREIVEALIGLMKHEDAQTRFHAVQSLGKIGPPAKALAYDPLMKARTDPEQPDKLRNAAGEALKSVAPRRTFVD